MFLPLQEEDSAFPFAELREIPSGSFLRPLNVLLNSSTTRLCISHPSQFSVACKFAEGMLGPIIQVINKDVR